MKDLLREFEDHLLSGIGKAIQNTLRPKPFQSRFGQRKPQRKKGKRARF